MDDGDAQEGSTKSADKSRANGKRSTLEAEIAADDPNTMGQQTLSDVLDLATFMARTQVYFDQLRRAELPATGMLIAAQMPDDSEIADAESWNNVLGMVQSQLRGIDVVCHYRANTVGILLPGCSIDAALERASRIQMLLEESRQDWFPEDQCPDRLSVAIAQAQDREEPGEYLTRLETALGEAVDSARFEIVVHDGTSTRVEATMHA